MDPERWRRAFDIFHAAMARDAGERAAFLADTCLGDESMRRAVEQLVSAHESAGDFLEVPAAIGLLAGDDHRSAARTDAASHADEFVGTERFTVLRTLGAGGMGIVYEVHDRARDQIVALKTLRRAGPADVYHIKREFRSLADVAHRNLVSLYELIVEGAECFFTMELVPGVNLVEYVRGASEGPGSLDVDRVRRVFHQLADGVSALHRHGKLHRDIKPSNVLVTPDGRVVILDFGLIADVVPEHGGGSSRPPPARRPTFHREHLRRARHRGQRLVQRRHHLYEALTGRVPFEGPFEEQLRRKRNADPPAPSRIAADVPDELSAICIDLLSGSVDRRLPGATRYALTPAVRRDRRRRRSRRAGTVFVGREHAGVLRRAFWRRARAAPHLSIFMAVGNRQERPGPALPRSTVGIGDVVILRGRCYEQETVPYKRSMKSSTV
jgi:predicted Ser/Thr protein kinase